MNTPRFNVLLGILILFFATFISGLIALGPNPGPQMLNVIEVEMDSGPVQSGRNIPRPRKRQTEISPVKAQPVQAAPAPPVREPEEHPLPDTPSVQPTADVQGPKVPFSPKTSLSGVPTTAAAAAVGFMSKEDYVQLLKMRVRSRKAYPDRAKKRNIQGLAVIQFKMEKNGQVSAVRVHQSSGSAILDRAALNAVRQAAPFPRAPQGMFSYPVRMRIGVSFELM